MTTFHRRTRLPLPSGEIVGCRVDCTVQDGSERVSFTMLVEVDGAEPGARTQPREVSSTGSNLAAALILYCRDHRIPLPSDGDKALRRFGDYVALVVTRNPRGKSVPKIDPA